MSRVDVVRAAMVEAMKAKDKARKDSLSMLLSALKNAEIDKLPNKRVLCFSAVLLPFTRT